MPLQAASSGFIIHLALEEIVLLGPHSDCSTAVAYMLKCLIGFPAVLQCVLTGRSCRERQCHGHKRNRAPSKGPFVLWSLISPSSGQPCCLGGVPLWQAEVEDVVHWMH